MEFRIAPEVQALGVRGAFAVLSRLDNRRYHPGFADYRARLTEQLKSELTPELAQADPVLRGFRDLHEAVKRSNRRFPASAEALVELFLRKGRIPEINPLVDIYNCVSLETRLSLGAHDVAKVQGDITLRLTDGSERFVPLGQSTAEPIHAGEYCYLDATGEVLCRLEHRQCERTKVTASTTGCFYILQGNWHTPTGMLEGALRRLIDLTVEFCGGREERFWIIGDRPESAPRPQS